MQLIDKDVLIKEINKIGGHLYSDWDTAGVLNLIYKQPIIEHPSSEWKINSNGYYPYCSNCGKEPNGGMSKYCPNCGAKMNGGS